MCRIKIALRRSFFEKTVQSIAKRHRQKHSDKNGVCFPSRRLIAEECCIDKKTVDAAIISLEKKGLVKKKKRCRQDGSNTSNAYTVKLFR